MKKLLGIVVLGLLVSFNVEAASYVFSKNLYTDCDILTKKDPTSFKNLVFEKEGQLLTYDRRTRDTRWTKLFIFQATFEKDYSAKILVNAEFKTKDKAEKQALKYGTMVGQLPNFLKENIETVTIHKGNKPWGGGNRDILIHTGDSGAKGKCGEEVMMHEAGHTSLDSDFGGSVEKYPWKKRAKADGKFISKYAKQYPDREDIAETINWWIAVRCKVDRISKSNYKKIIEAIPNRLKYLDEQNYDTYPLVCK